MNGREHEELLSAYHDGELAAGEGADVAQWLAEDGQARDTLEEIADLSRLLAACPTPAAPADLRTAVMERVRQSAPVRAAPRAPTARPSRRYWVLGAATVAGLFLAVLTIPHMLNRNAPVGGIAATEQSAPAPAETARSPFASRTPELPAAADSASAVDDVPPPMAMVLPAAQPEDAADLHDLEVAVSSGSPPQIGETLKRLVREGEELRIVQYTVLDIRKAFGQMQVLLQENGIRGISPDGTVTVVRQPQSGEMLAIVVEAADDKLDGALTAMEGDSSVRGMVSSELSAVTQFPLPEPAVGVESLQPPQDVNPPPPAPAESAIDPAAAPRASAARSEQAEDIAVPIAVPLSSKLMQSVLPIEDARSADRDNVRGRGDVPVRSAPQGASRKPAEGPAVAMQRSRILIVLVPEGTKVP